MTTTSLPNRLRLVADFIEQHDLPDRTVTVSGEPYNHVSIAATCLGDVEAIADALGVQVTHMEYVDGEDGPWTAHRADMSYVDADTQPIHIAAQFSETPAVVPA